MGLVDHMSENVSNNGQQSWRQWEPDHEPPMDGKPDLPDVSCAGSVEPLPAPTSLPASSGVPSNVLVPLNHHNQLTRFMAKQTLGYIPKLSVRSPERSMSPPSAVYGGMSRDTGVFNFESPRASIVRSPSFRLPSIGTPPLSPQKWAGPSPFSSQDDEISRPSLPALNQNAGSFIQRSGSFSETIPPLKRPHQETTHHVMSIADLCQPFQYVRASSCPSDTNPGAPRSNPATPPQENVPLLAVEQSWKPAIEPQAYIRTQSCSSDADTLRGSLPHRSEEMQHNRLERSSSMDAPTLMRHLKRTAAESIDLTQWLDRPCRSSLSSLADSADSMHQLEQAGRSMRISDSPRADHVASLDSCHEAKREKKLCAFPQCSSNAVTRGLCISHGGGRRCQRKGCTRGAQSKGLCVAHGGGRICRAAGCSNIQRSMGLCIRHGGGRRCSVKGCQKGVVRQDLCTAHGGKRKCRVLECTKHVKKKGLCRSHANSMYATLGPHWHLGEITDSERQAVRETLLLRSVGGVLKHGEIVRAAAYFRVGRQVDERIWRRGINSMGDRVAAVVKSRKSACGRKKVDRAALGERIAAVPVNERENQRLLQRASNMSCYLVQQLIKEGYIRRALTRPLLTRTHKLARLRHKDKQRAAPHRLPLKFQKPH
ncbi:hypothetical protein PInf_024159 [Phytophthora infestans]|nr:hypothetical protein PInf_024159 [Phytophthora infestans]